MKKIIRCPDCGDIVNNFFDHVDINCLAIESEEVLKGRSLKKQSEKLERQSGFAITTILLLFGIAFIFMIFDIISASFLLLIILSAIALLWVINSNIEQQISKVEDQIFKLKK